MKVKLYLTWLKIKLFWTRVKQYAWIAAAIALLAAILWLIFARPGTSAYYYIDWNDNHGVATDCWVEKSGLYCTKQYGGTVAVKQFCEVND